MNKNKSYLSGSLILVLGNVVGAVSSFVRNIIVARLVSVEDFGIAMTFAITMSFFEMASNMAVDRYIIQAKLGNNKYIQGVGQAFQAIRGIVAGIILFFLAGILSAVFGIPESKWAFQILALVPFMRGFVHFDMVRAQRTMKFWPITLVGVVPQIITMLLAAPFAMYFADFRAMLYLILFQTFLLLILSHFVSKRPYIWYFSKEYLRSMVIYGWPLTINGFLMFGVLQGDRAIIAAFYSMEALGAFSAVFGFTLMPQMILAKVVRTLMMPNLARSFHNDAEKPENAYLSIQLCLLLGVLLSVTLMLIGPSIFIGLYGEKYSGSLIFFSFLSILQGVRLMKSGPLIVAMSYSETKNPMISNIVRTLFFGIVFLGITLGWGINEIVLCGIVGELTSFLVAIILLRYSNHISLSPLLFQTIFSIGLLFTVYFLIAPFIVNLPYLWVLAIFLLLITSIIYLLLMVLPELRMNLDKFKILKLSNK